MRWQHRSTHVIGWLVASVGIVKLAYAALGIRQSTVLSSTAMVAMATLEVVSGALLVVPRTVIRRVGAMLLMVIGVGTLFGALLLTWAGYDMEECGCFPAWRASLIQHCLISAVLAVLGLSIFRKTLEAGTLAVPE